MRMLGEQMECVVDGADLRRNNSSGLYFLL